MLELAVSWLYDADRTLEQPYRDDLSARLFEPSFRELVGSDIHAKADLIRRQGNAAVHKTRPVTPNDSLALLGQLFHLLYWLARKYARDPADLPSETLRFDPQLVPRPVSAQARLQRQAELAERERQLAEDDRHLAEERAQNDALQAELAELRKQVAA
ncbi:MAG: DUF4145 domain-containing protein, partial [Actinomycetota bacterium]|nr:DUF4145 domain-containing protein [Actinomycetota bacterium]